MTLELDGLTHRYGDELAIEDVSFEIEAGETVGLLGPSGCGKTTTAQAVAGHVRPTEGRVRLRGRDVTDDPPETRRVGVVFQEPTLFPHMTVAENVAYGLMGRESEERADTVGEYLELVSLVGQREATPPELSGGQRRRVEFARALAPEPDVLVLDEPLSGLDRALRERLRGEIARIQRDTGVTTLYVTHDQEAAMALADRLVILSEGRVTGVGPPGDLYESPPTAFVASFLGRANRLPVAPEVPGLEPDQAAADGGKAGKATADDSGGQCLVRPEDISLGDPPEDTSDDGSGVCLPGLVTRVADLGSRYEVTVELDAGSTLTAERRADPPTEGSRVTVGVDDENVMRFEE